MPPTLPAPRLSLALAAASLGWEVHPCLPAAEGDRKAKTPYTYWTKEATNDPSTIRGWWKRWPAALVGARTGEGVAVLDFDSDPAKGLSANKAQAALEALLGPLPATYTSVTPRGGRHLYYTTPIATKTAAAVLDVLGADVRGHGGYVILYGDSPPDPYALAELPEAYRLAFVYKPAPAPLLEAPRGDAARPVPDAATMKAVSEHLSTLENPPEGARHQQVLSMARLIGGYVGGGHLAYSDALSMLLDAVRLHSDFDDSRRALVSGLLSGMAAPLHPGIPKPRPIVAPSAASSPSPAPPALFARTTRTLKGGVVIDVASFPNAVLDLLGCAQFASLTGDTFRGSMTLNAEAVTDSTMLRIRLDLYSITGLNHRPQDVEAAVTHVASNVRGINPVTDYLKGLKWDGVPRIQDWLGHSFGIQTTSQEQAYQRKFFIAMVARILSPGCKVDDCLSIIGPPGIKKSSLFRALVPSPDLFTDSHMDLENKDTFMKLRRVVLVEIGEERDFLRGGQEATKRFLSTQEDFYRAPYGRAVESHARHCVFVITTNARRPTIFMDFTSEGRRYWPISLYDRPGLHDAALDWVLKHRQQLWAEAVTAYQQGELYYFDSPHDKAAHQEHFRQYLETDPTDLQVEAALDALNKDRVTLGEVLERMRVPISEYSKNTRRVSAALERVGWEVVSYSSTKHRSKVAVWGNKHASPAAPAHSLPKWRGVPTDDDGVPM